MLDAVPNFATTGNREITAHVS